MTIMFLSNENYTCPKEQIMHNELSLALSFADTIHKLF